jgi:antitoxin (DNA-binding transcriptional repressor) of toxin-antitoxin stability system
MISVNVHEAKTHLSRLLERIAAGEEILISKADKPMAKANSAFQTANQSGSRAR